jgi:hypothetical protein
LLATAEAFCTPKNQPEALIPAARSGLSFAEPWS